MIMKQCKKVIKEMSVKEFVEEYNKSNKEKVSINRHNVYDMIKEGKLKAHKGYKGAWVLEIEVETSKTYTTKEFVEEYNKKHKKQPITVVEVRQLIERGVIDAEKVAGKWVIKSTPSKRIK